MNTMHDRLSSFDRPSRFAAYPGDMKLPPRCLYPSSPVPSLWRVLLCTGMGNEISTWTWQNYAGTSTEASERALDWLRHELWAESGCAPHIRVLEVLQVGT
jgi:hypothetical protein